MTTTFQEKLSDIVGITNGLIESGIAQIDAITAERDNVADHLRLMMQVWEFQIKDYTKQCEIFRGLGKLSL